MREERGERPARRWAGIAIAAVAGLALIGVGYAVARAYEGAPVAEALGAALGTIAISVALVALVRAFYVRFFAAERPIFSAPWVLGCAAVLALVTLPGRLDRIAGESEGSEASQALLEIEPERCERDVEALPGLGRGYEYERLSRGEAARSAPALSALPRAALAQIEGAILRGPDFDASVLAVPYGDFVDFEADVTAAFVRQARSEGLEPQTSEVAGGTLTYVSLEPRRGFSGLHFGTCHLRNVTAFSLGDVTATVEALVAAE